MLWIKSFHIIFMVTWFAGLFYLPRLYVYHALCPDTDSIGRERFKIMEKKLYYSITTPAAILTLLFGLWLIGFNPHGYMQMLWLHLKLTFVLILILYHIYLGMLLHNFLRDKNQHGHLFYRILNEVPVVLLIIIVLLVVIKP